MEILFTLIFNRLIHFHVTIQKLKAIKQYFFSVLFINIKEVDLFIR